MSGLSFSLLCYMFESVIDDFDTDFFLPEILVIRSSCGIDSRLQPGSTEETQPRSCGRRSVCGKVIGGSELPEAFEFMGLTGGFQILLDPHTGIPIGVRGELRVAGRPDFKLTEVVLTDDTRKQARRRIEDLAGRLQRP